MLGFEVGEATVSRYMPRRRKPPSHSWRAFLKNHTQDLVSIDFFVVPTATFRVLYDKGAPDLRQRESADGGKVIALPMVGGLHHRYTRVAA
jgi:hypothetical protein